MDSAGKCPTIARGGGGGGWAQLELTDALPIKYMYVKSGAFHLRDMLLVKFLQYNMNPKEQKVKKDNLNNCYLG